MRPEEFDKHLNQKLEGLNPRFNEKDWDRLSQKLNSRKSFIALISSNPRFILLILILLICFGVVFQHNLFDFQMSKSNIETNSPKLKQVFITEASDTELSSNTIVDEVNKSDNPYLTKALQNSIPTSQLNLNQRHSKDLVIRNQNQNSSQNIIKSTVPKNVIKSNELVTSIENSVSNLSNKRLDVVDNLNQVMQNSNGAQEPLTTSENTLEEDKKILDSKIIVLEKLKIHDFYEVTYLQEKQIIKPIQGIKPNRWLIGALGLVTERHLNLGLGFEIKTNKNISFCSGLMHQNYFTQNFGDQNDFSAITQEEFTNLIKPRHGKSSSFTNIRIKSKDWLLPLQLKYYIPFNTHYAAFVTGGLQLTLKSNTVLDFGYISWDPQVAMDEYGFDQASNHATLINHFVFGAGIQKEFRNLSWQVSAILQKNNTNQPYITKVEPALQLGVYYKL